MTATTRYGLALLTWTIAGIALWVFEQQLDLANLAMGMVLASALSAMWLPGWASMILSVLAVTAFNWFFVPPKFELSVHLNQNALLLVVLLLVNWIIAGLMIRQRQLVESAQALAAREAQLRAWGDLLRDAQDPAAHAAALRTVLQETTGVEVVILVRSSLHADVADASVLAAGEPNQEQQDGLTLCWREGKALGALTGRYEQLPDVYLPLRGRGVSVGAALLMGFGGHPMQEALLPHVQALCDQMGSALQRAWIALQEQQARELAQLQATRTALLAAISHDYRTPLATIMGAASSLQLQSDRLDAVQRQQLAQGIVEEAERLARLTENTLQLARLEGDSVSLQCGWESAEEIVGALLRRLRHRPEGHRVRVRLEPNLSLFWCDALLITQLLDNLLDNALKYSPADAAVELAISAEQDDLVLTVTDHGRGIAPAWREKVFEVFQRGDPEMTPAVFEQSPGAGVGLAVCRAIATAHQGTLSLITPPDGGSCFECRLPLRGAGQSLPEGQVPEARS